MMSLPLSLIGVVLALLLTGTTLNVMSLIGIMLLMGIVARNAILLTLLVIPTVYEILDQIEEWLMRKVLGRKPRIGPAASGLASEAGD